ncbi:hypothetical protein GCM10011583_72600 [Streptomyces camponoticapitis]|uniref:Secreted protein n=1 Tax=Streptomyces camponoticapitis TaxID=1616125 RepID=A0ABQ2EXS3_9ACTN|nr:hypothetical protein [Streptomyces camponoticapitis]GGK30159.1 hypothetical protein GCM10011583_72600 [Streptomyces camponoticapitis]
MDWISPLTGHLGVFIGAAISLIGSKRVADQQPTDAQAARDATERIAVASALSTTLAALFAKARQVPHDAFPYRSPRGDSEEQQYARQRAAEKVWEEEWWPLLRDTRMAALEVRDHGLRELLADAVRYREDLDVMEVALHGRHRALVVSRTVDHVIECVFAWRRGENLPAQTEDFEAMKGSWQVWADTNEALAQHQQLEEERRRRRAGTDDRGSGS